jgi:hypothetical protein
MAYAFSPRYPVIILTCFFIFANLRHAIKNHRGYLGEASVKGFLLRPSGHCVLYFKNARILQGSVLHGVSYLSSFFIILAIRSKSTQKHYIVIPKDSIPLFAYQRLLAHMRAIPAI